MTGRQDDRKEYDRTKDRQRILDEYMIDISRPSPFFKGKIKNQYLIIMTEMEIIYGQQGQSTVIKTKRHDMDRG
jgi:hypothetical protein